MAIQLAGLHPVVRQRAELALRYAQHYGVPVTITSAYRGSAQQDYLYQQYRKCIVAGTFGTNACPTRWPANPPGESAHEFRMAWDSTVPPQFQAWWNHVRRALGFNVPTNDVIHAEVPNWRNYR